VSKSRNFSSEKPSVLSVLPHATVLCKRVIVLVNACADGNTECDDNTRETDQARGTQHAHNPTQPFYDPGPIVVLDQDMAFIISLALFSLLV
jgi:hypothetical protein